MVNCNPETVSTDYDTSDRLYFEPLTAEDVLEIVRVEQSKGTLAGVIVQFGGQTPLKLANTLVEEGVPILGTSADAIDLAEDRKRFQVLLNELGLKQPRNATAMTADETIAAARAIGYPVILRPSYVLGGRGMVVCADEAHLKTQVQSGELFRISGDNPVLIDGFLHHAIEVDVDAICDDDGEVFIAGIMEHIEEAGVHSGDSACAIPPHSLKPEPSPRSSARPSRWRGALKVRGLMNVQYAIQDGDIFVLEVNPRASRTVPFVAKAIGLPVAAIAARVMAGELLKSFDLTPSKSPHISVKEAVMPFARFPGVDTILGPGDALDRRSHGPRREFRPRLRQEPDRRRPEAAARRQRVHLGARQRQGLRRRAGARHARAGLRHRRHARHRRRAGRRRRRRQAHQQGR